MDTPWWQELWRRHAHITTPLRERGLECDIEFGLSAYIVRVALPDDSHLIISPPQEPPSERPPGDPEGWIVTREHPDYQSLFEVLYDSAPSDDPGASQRPEARHGGSAQLWSRLSTTASAGSGCCPTPPRPPTPGSPATSPNRSHLAPGRAARRAGDPNPDTSAEHHPSPSLSPTGSHRPADPRSVHAGGWRCCISALPRGLTSGLR
ncbi:hypothetical protein ACGFZQ_49840 [Streptomyces sp. NPDC048254]|uniref:hypothetical protein n=1 Tax=Streptomyces sp. NPDC048254 TaxID=3365525 RepID=UPI00371DD9E7